MYYLLLLTTILKLSSLKPQTSSHTVSEGQESESSLVESLLAEDFSVVAVEVRVLLSSWLRQETVPRWLIHMAVRALDSLPVGRRPCYVGLSQGYCSVLTK